jgi:hypothetical protein
MQLQTAKASLVGCTLFAVGCSAPKVSSNPDDCAPSLSRVAQSVRGKDSVAYVNAMVYITGLAGFHSAGEAVQSSLANTFTEDAASVTLSSPDSADIATAACLTLAGQGAKSIIANKDSFATRMSARLDERMAIVHRKTLEDERAAFLATQDSLSRFQVESAKLTQTQLKTTVQLTVRNGTGHSISRVLFTARALGDANEAPWLDEELDYHIAGGLAPGARATWRIQPPNTIGGKWNRVKVPSTARFVLQPTQLYTADGALLWGARTFTRGDQRLLDSLKSAR